MRVGKPHGLDGSFHVESLVRSRPSRLLRPEGPLAEGDVVEIGGSEYTVAARKGGDAKPIVRLAGVEDRTAAERLRGQTIATRPAEPPGEGEWLVDDLVGCRVEGLGEVTRVLEGPSCDVLEVGEQLIPLVTDAVTEVDTENKRIEVNRGFLGL